MPKIENGNWVTKMIQEGVLQRVPDEVPPAPGGVTLVCDSETNPTRVVQFGVKDRPVRLIINEAGVLIASPDRLLREKIQIDPERVILDPLVRSWREGITYVLLCVSPHSITGPMLDMHTVPLVDHLVRAGEWLASRLEGLNVGHIVHLEFTDGDRANYYVSLDAWRTFYERYETTVLGRLDDGVDFDDLPRRPGDDHFTDPDFAQA